MDSQKKEITISDQELYELRKKNKKVYEFSYLSYTDYTGARCCFLNNLQYPAYLLSQQAIEKMVKTTIMSYDSNFIPEKYSKHKITDLFKILHTLSRIDYSRHFEFTDNLYRGYLAFRYPDSMHKADRNWISVSSTDYEKLDDLYFDLWEDYNVPTDVKYVNVGLYYCLARGPIRGNESEFDNCSRLNRRYLERFYNFKAYGVAIEDFYQRRRDRIKANQNDNIKQ